MRQEINLLVSIDDVFCLNRFDLLGDPGRSTKISATYFCLLFGPDWINAN